MPENMFMQGKMSKNGLKGEITDGGGKCGELGEVGLKEGS